MASLTIIDKEPDNAITFDNENVIENLESFSDIKAPIILFFPTFMDGRALSQARKLRRNGYKGNLIASGDLRADQARNYESVGFSSLLLNNHIDSEVLKASLSYFNTPYQHSNTLRDTVFEKRIHLKECSDESGGGPF